MDYYNSLVYENGAVLLSSYFSVGYTIVDYITNGFGVNYNVVIPQ